MLQESKIISLINDQRNYVVHFIEGQKVVHDLALIHDLKGGGFNYLRDFALSTLSLIPLLKPQESFGLYIDSEIPDFMLKMEMSELGQFRTLLLPDSMTKVPEKISGKARLSKISPSESAPYNSIISLNNKGLKDVVNSILSDSYQVKGEVIVSDSSDQAAFILQLPKHNWDKEEIIAPVPIEQFINQSQPFLNKIFAMGLNDISLITEEFEANGFHTLITKDIQFKCNCSYERMAAGIKVLVNTSSVDDVFLGEDSIETKCDYCKTFYQIPAAEFKN